jgi:hypothetical protein
VTLGKLTLSKAQQQLNAYYEINVTFGRCIYFKAVQSAKACLPTETKLGRYTNYRSEHPLNA